MVPEKWIRYTLPAPRKLNWYISYRTGWDWPGVALTTLTLGWIFTESTLYISALPGRTSRFCTALRLIFLRKKIEKKKHPQGDALNATLFSLGLLALLFSAVAVNPAVRVIFLRLIQGCCRSFGSGSSSEGTRTYESGDGISAPSIFSDRCLCSSRSLLCYLALPIATSAPRWRYVNGDITT